MINDTEPVAWRYLTRNGWSVTTVKGVADFQQSEGFVVEPLYTALAQSNAEPEHDVRVTDKMVDTAQRSLYGDFSVADVNAVRRALEAAEALSDAEPVARARYHLRAADHALHEVEGDPFADHAHTLVHEAAFMITDEPELQVLRRLPESGATLTQSDAEPFAWAFRMVAENWTGDWQLTLKRDALLDRTPPIEAVPLYTHPPALAQSDAEPVAWRYAYPGYPGHWNVTSDKLTVDERQGNSGCIIEPLYTTTPRPDASVGLIEAAECLEASNTKWGASWSPCVMSVAKWLRVRAADRSGE